MSLHPDRISELLVPFLENQTLSPAQHESLGTYLDLLLKWNAKVNLTSIRDPEEIVTRHFGESLFAARHLFSAPSPDSVIDIGSGAGFPGIPIKIWNDAVELTLIESNGKKAAFLREVARVLNLNQVNVYSRRAEDFSAKGSVVTLRAVERFEQILPTARTLLQPNGRIVLLIGEAQVQAARSALSDLTWLDPIRIPLSDKRVLFIGSR